MRDAFISHATEDKEDLARPLANFFDNLGLKIWYDEFELKPGDSLSEKIAEGLNQSKYGIVILSPNFLKKEWPKHELKGLITLMLSRKSKILPVWHNLTKDDVVAFNPSIADIVAISTAGKTPALVGFELLKTLEPKLFVSVGRQIAYRRLLESTRKKPAHKVPISSLKQGPIRHKSLPTSILMRAGLVVAVLREAMPASEEFVENLQRDLNYEDELKIWESIAYIYDQIKFNFKLSDSQREELLGKLLVISMTPGREVQKILKDSTLDDKIIDFVKSFY